MTEPIDTIRERILEEQYGFEDLDPVLKKGILDKVLRDARAMTLAFDALVKKLKSHPPNIYMPVKVPGPREWHKWDQFTPRERLVLRQLDTESEMCELSAEIATSSSKETAQTEETIESIKLTSEDMMWLWGAAGELLLGGDAPEVKLAKTIRESDDRLDLIQQLRIDLQNAAHRLDQHMRDLTIALEALDKVAVESTKLVLRHSIAHMKELRAQIDVAAVRTTNSAP
jgi:hypothetical protein